MASVLLPRERAVLAVDAVADLRAWRVPAALRGSYHGLTYALALVVRGMLVLRSDNAVGKGDHRHGGAIERPCRFVDAETSLADFWKDVDAWLTARPS